MAAAAAFQPKSIRSLNETFESLKAARMAETKYLLDFINSSVARLDELQECIFDETVMSIIHNCNVLINMYNHNHFSNKNQDEMMKHLSYLHQRIGLSIERSHIEGTSKQVNQCSDILLDNFNCTFDLVEGKYDIRIVHAAEHYAMFVTMFGYRDRESRVIVNKIMRLSADGKIRTVLEMFRDAAKQVHSVFANVIDSHLSPAAVPSAPPQRDLARPNFEQVMERLIEFSSLVTSKSEPDRRTLLHEYLIGVFETNDVSEEILSLKDEFYRVVGQM
jgi:hypothetical protein